MESLPQYPAKDADKCVSGKEFFRRLKKGERSKNSGLTARVGALELGALKAHNG